MSLAEHPDRLRWNAKYGPGYTASFAPHPLAVEALSMGLPDGPVVDLACGPSGSALLAAGGGREVTAVDISEIALRLLGWEAFTLAALRARPKLCADWCLAPGEPASLLPADFEVIRIWELPHNEPGTKRRLLARRMTTPGPASG